MIWLLAFLLSKHFIIDFPLQPKWMYANKGTFGHPGGLFHAALHGHATILILGLMVPGLTWELIMGLGWGEIVAHYLIDWAKMNLNRKLGWGPTTHEQFWWLLGLDQWLHGMCYVAIVYAVTS